MAAEVRESNVGSKPSYSGFCGECVWFTPRNPFMAKEEVETRVEEHNAIWHRDDEFALLEQETPEQIEQRKRGTGAWHRHTRNWPGPMTGWTPGC